MRFREEKRLRRKDALKAGVAAAVALALLAGGAAALHFWENDRYATGSDEVGSAVIAAPEEQKEITYDGSTYRQRSGLETYLIMGIDVKGKAVAVDSYEGGGQADVQMVLVVDDANKTWQVLQINRDTITKVPVLDVLGGVAAYADEQIALAHYYGNGRENSCENTALAVSMLLDDQPIDGYFALNMDAVGIVTDLVGGVTLTVTSDFSEIDPTLVQGEEVTLDGEKALTYVRSRHHIDDQTNIARMARQRQFLAALEEKLRQQDSQFAAEAYTALEDYMVTDIASGTAAKIGEKLKQYKQLDTLTIDGETSSRTATGPTIWTSPAGRRPSYSCFMKKYDKGIGNWKGRINQWARNNRHSIRRPSTAQRQKKRSIS